MHSTSELHPPPEVHHAISSPVFENLRARLDRFLRDHSAPDQRAKAAALREALLEAKVGVGTMQSALAATERELEGERRQLIEAERRGRLAADVPDAETVALAERFAVRHRARVTMLERKLAVQRDELALAEREVVDILAEYRAARSSPPNESIDAAWRDLHAAGGERPGTGLEDEPAEERNRKLSEAVEAQLAYLKKKLGRQP